jgi:hypothetical protein
MAGDLRAWAASEPDPQRRGRLEQLAERHEAASRVQSEAPLQM